MDLRAESCCLILSIALPIAGIAEMAGADVLLVPSEFATIQSAIDAAVDGDEIIVSSGLYFEAIDFLGKMISVRGVRGPSNTIIDASGVLAPVVTMIDVPQGAELSGFTIQGGTGVPSEFSDLGGGIYLVNSSPLISHCILRNMYVSGAGGGAYIEGGSPRFFSCTFFDNTARIHGGGLFAREANLQIFQCIVQGNGGERGAGVRLLACEATIANSLIIENGGGSTGDGGGISASYSTYSLRSSVLANNAAVLGRSIGGEFNTIDVSNVVIWGAQPGQVSNGDSFVSFEHCNIRASGGSGAGWNIVLGDDLGNNIDTDPLFRDLLGPDGIPRTGDEDFTLLPGSPCIDAGVNASAAPDLFDLDGDGDTTEPTPFDARGLRRFVDDVGTPDTGAGMAPIVDIGPYEFQGTSALSDMNADGVVNGADLATLIANWGPCAAGVACAADLDGDGAVGVTDLTILLKNWV